MLDSGDDGAKHPIKSKTINANILALALLPLLPPEKRNDPMFLQSFVAIMALANIVLRFFTKGKIDLDE